jgi:hypothetical protein
VKMVGSVEFQNPYGYLSGIYYGYLPFEGARAALFGVFTLVYYFLLFLHRHTLLVTNWFILAVVSICTIESILWFAAYSDMNTNGEPYCCPFPTLIAASMIIQSFRATLSRALMLTICLGLGLAREKLTKKEVMVICALSMLYLGSSLTLSANDVMQTNNLHHDSQESGVLWELPELVLDIIFLMWIYIALIDTMTDLQKSGQR